MIGNSGRRRKGRDDHEARTELYRRRSFRNTGDEVVSDQEHVELFLQGVEPWNKMVDSRSARLEGVDWGYVSDLSDEAVGYRVFDKAVVEGTSFEEATDYRGINFRPVKFGRVSVPAARAPCKPRGWTSAAGGLIGPISVART